MGDEILSLIYSKVKDDDTIDNILDDKNKDNKNKKEKKEKKTIKIINIKKTMKTKNRISYT